MLDPSSPVHDDAASLTVGQVAARICVTVRALHHWDEIALARLSSRSTAGYRLYTSADLERLRRIVIYRELGLDLEAIRAILDDPQTDVTSKLRVAHTQLAERIERLQALSGELERMMDAHDHGVLMSADEQAEALGPTWNADWPAQARQRYGDTTQWRQYAERAAGRSSDDWRALAETSRAFDRALSQAMDAGVAAGSREANALVERHRQVFSAYFPISQQMQVCLGRMYEADPAYAAHYDAIRPGLAGWLRSIIDASARSHGVDPDAATWQ